jgi:hypothetical protein
MRARRDHGRFAPRRLAVLLLLAIAGCSGGGATPGAGSAGSGTGRWAFEREFPGPGYPASLVIRLDRVELGLADRVLMEEELRVQEGFESEFPEYLPEDFDGFSVVAIERESPRPAAGTAEDASGGEGSAGDAAGGEAGARVERRRLTLEPDRSGDLAIAPLAVYFHERGKEAESHFLTEEIPVKVAAIEDVGALDLRPARSIFEAPPEEGGGSTLAWTAAGAGAIALLAVLVRAARRRPRRAPPPTPPHEIAYDALRRLAALGLIEKGEIELFFVHLSGILRAYIESRFLVRAPERTTEEFLEEAAGHAALGAYRARLGEFLALSDRVKFARFEPDEAAIQGAFDALKQFLAETTPDEPQNV